MPTSILRLASCFAFLIASFLSHPATAEDRGIGFGWETNAGEAIAYQVNLTTGAATSLGTIPDLKTVVVGSHNVDYTTGVSVLVGSKAGDNPNTLFLLVPKSQLIFSFKIAGITEDTSVQRALVRASDGAIFVLTSDRGSSLLTLHKVTFNVSTASAALTIVAAVEVPGFSIDGVKIADDGKVYILTAGTTKDSLLSIDTITGSTASVDLSQSDHQGLFLCDQTNATPRFFTFLNTRAPQTNTALNEFTSAGIESTRIASLNLNTIAGSYSCTDNTLRVLSSAGGDDRDAPAALSLASFAVTTPTAAFQETALSQTNLKFVGITKAALPNPAAQQLSIYAAKKFALLSAAAVKSCVAQLGNKNPLPKGKKAAFRAVAKGLAKIRRRGGSCVLS